MQKQLATTIGSASVVVLTISLVLGCSVTPDKPVDSIAFPEDAKGSQSKTITPAATISDRAEAASQSATVSNPLAKEIRFGGQERVLGGGNCRALDSKQLLTALRGLLDAGKKRSASALVRLHTRSAQRMLIEHTGQSDDAIADFVAAAVDQGKPSGAWSQHRLACKANPEAVAKFTSTRNIVLSQAPPTGQLAEAMLQLNQAAVEVDSLPLKLETQRLAAMASAASADPTGAVNTLASAAELAAQSGMPHASSELWMMACQASMQLDNVSQARKCWHAAVASQLAAVRSRPSDQLLPTVDTVFWEQADRLKHPQDQFPKELTLAMAPWYSRIGFTPGSTPLPQVALWSAIAEFQLATGQPHLAALSIKRAEVGAVGPAKQWLQIALARAMASQGQESVAVTILGSLEKDASPAVRAAALATLGSIKVQSGAYEQGSRFLIQALNTPQAGNWAGKLSAKADLANVRLIVGKLDDALPALHAVQNEMMTAGLWQSLCQSLENEAAILTHEGRSWDAQKIRERIQTIENS